MLLKIKTMKFIKVFLPTFLIFLSFPIISHGFALDPAMTALQGLSEATGPTFAFYFSSFLFYILTLAALFITTSLLQWAIDITPVALTLGGTEGYSPVEMGWAFSVGIVNMLLILAFLVIAFSVILGIERIQLKKALPNLILVALLTNFTLLFVGMAIDISNFLFNTVAMQFGGDGGNIIFNAVEPLFAIGQDTFGVTIALLATRAVGLVVPYLNVAIQVGWIIALPMEIIPSSLNFLFFGLSMGMMSFLCLLFFFVFIARIFVIQILAIFAPLAFFCIIFDDTRKWFNEWLKHFVQWLFVGVIFISLLYFGLAMAPVVVQLAQSNLVDFADNFPWWLPIRLSEVIGNLVLLCYFAVIFFIAKGLVPAAANAVISQAAGAVKMATPWAGALAKGGVSKLRNDLVRSKEGTPENMQGSDAVGRLNNFAYTNRVSRGFNKWAQKADFAITGKKTEEHVQGRIEERSKELNEKHGDSLADVANNPAGKLIFSDPASQAALAHAFASKGKDLSGIKDNDFKNRVFDSGNKYLSSSASTKMNALNANFFDGEENEERSNKLYHNMAGKKYKEKSDKFKFKESDTVDGYKSMLLENDGAKKKEFESIIGRKITDAEMTGINGDVVTKLINEGAQNTAHKKMSSSIKQDDIKNLSGDVIGSKAFQTIVLQNQSGSFFQKMFEEHGSGTMDTLDNRLQELISTQRLTNRTLERQIQKTPAVGVLFAGSKEILSPQRRAPQQSEGDGEGQQQSEEDINIAYQ